MLATVMMCFMHRFSHVPKLIIQTLWTEHELAVGLTMRKASFLLGSSRAQYRAKQVFLYQPNGS